MSKKNINKQIVEQLNEDEPFLTPIEDPSDPELKQGYAYLNNTMGKVMTPLKVFSARLPKSFNAFYQQIGQLDQELDLPKELAMLIRQQVARINVCLFCIDSNKFASLQEKVNLEKINALDQYNTNPLFTESERIALDYVTELTEHKRVDLKTFLALKNHFSERQICEIVYLTASEHIYNITNIGLNIHSDNFCELRK